MWKKASDIKNIQMKSQIKTEIDVTVAHWPILFCGIECLFEFFILAYAKKKKKTMPKTAKFEFIAFIFVCSVAQQIFPIRNKSNSEQKSKASQKQQHQRKCKHCSLLRTIVSTINIVAQLILLHQALIWNIIGTIVHGITVMRVAKVNM